MNHNKEYLQTKRPQVITSLILNQLHGQDQDSLLKKKKNANTGNRHYWVCIIFQHRRQYAEYVLGCAGNCVFVCIGILDTR